MGGAELRAAVELISPRNRDRPQSRQVFVTRCASYHHRGVSLVLVDIVTNRHSNLHGEFLNFLQRNGTPPWQSPTNLYAVAYQKVLKQGQRRLEMWWEVLRLGEPLPSLPLWIDVDQAVPLPLEESFVEARRTVRFPVGRE